MRIMTANIWGDYFGNPVEIRDEQIINTCKRYDPDVIGFQEITKSWYNSLLFKTLHEDYNLVGTELFDSVNYVPMAIKKNYKILNKGYEYLEETPDKSKGITWAVIEDENGKKVIVCNTHFWWMTGPEHDVIRVKNAHQLCNLMEMLKNRYNCPVFAFGDMNTYISSDVFKIYKERGVIHLHDIAKDKDNVSSHHGDPVKDENGIYHGKKTERDYNFSIDHIICLKDDIEVSQYRIIEDQDSLDATDHSLVYADVEF